MTKKGKGLFRSHLACSIAGLLSPFPDRMKMPSFVGPTRTAHAGPSVLLDRPSSFWRMSLTAKAYAT